MPTKFILPKEIGKDQLMAIVRGQSTAFPRTRAIAAVHQADLTDSDKLKLYGDLLKNKRENTRIRHHAVRGLYGMKDAKKVCSLLKRQLKRTEDPKVVCSIVQALGRLGSIQELENLKEAAGRMKGYAKQQANFAAALISFRAGRSDAKLSFPRKNQLLPLSANNRNIKIEIKKATRREVGKVLASMQESPFGITLSNRAQFQVKCQPSDWMIALNEEFSTVDEMQVLKKRRGVLGQYLLRNKEKGDYATAFLILSTPKRGGELALLLKTPDGKTHYAGIAKVEEDAVRFSIQAVNRPGASPVKISGVFRRDRIEEVSAASSSKALNRKVPKSV